MLMTEGRKEGRSAYREGRKGIVKEGRKVGRNAGREEE